MAIYLLLLATPFIIILLFLYKKLHPKSNSLLPPGPPGLPFLGNLHQLDGSAPHLYFCRLSQKYGPLMLMRFGFRTTLVVSSAKMAAEVLKTHDLDFCSRPCLLAARKLSYNGLDVAFGPYSSYWREMRKLCVLHLFGHSRVQLHRRIREDEVSIMVHNLSKSFAGDPKPINLSDAMMRLTSNIICRVGFGKRYDYEGSSDFSKFEEMFREAQGVLASFFVSDYLPLMGWVDRLSGLRPRLEKVYEQLDAFYQQLIDEHLDELRRSNPPSEEEEDIIHVLLRLTNNVVHSANSISHFSFDNIKAILMNVYLAGTDTSAATVVWAMAYLMKNHSRMKKARYEIRNSIGKKGFVDEDDLQNLPYLRAVVKETFRMQPTSPLLVPRETIRKCKLESYEIPAKTLVYVNAWAIGRDPEAWENPEEFYPERFIGSSIDYKGLDFELIPFGAGRRGCPGMEMGALTVELALANLLYKFDWEMPIGMEREDLDFDARLGITMHKKNALSLVGRNFVLE